MNKIHTIRFKYSGLVCSCGWKFNFIYELTIKDFMNEPIGSFREEIRNAINTHKLEFMKDGEYIPLIPGSTSVTYKLKSLCTKEEIEESKKIEQYK
jgi:hypothetical protein